ncbi:hypothetical protein Pelo_18710 [Pelomyxa schiedti]|nr:hypothetical protein Pelo_18710 [Pelomyxa schiedti]
MGLWHSSTSRRSEGYCHGYGHGSVVQQEDIGPDEYYHHHQDAKKEMAQRNEEEEEEEATAQHPPPPKMRFGRTKSFYPSPEERDLLERQRAAYRRLLPAKPPLQPQVPIPVVLPGCGTPLAAEEQPGPVLRNRRRPVVPVPAPTYGVGVGGRAQVAALAAACHPRCGARAAARLIWRHEGLPQYLWELVRESRVSFYVCLMNPKFHVLHFGISALTLGVLAEPRELCVKAFRCRNVTSAGRSHLNIVKKEMLGGRRCRYALMDAMRGDVWLLMESGASYTQHAANHKWWLCYNFKESTLHVANLARKAVVPCYSDFMTVEGDVYNKAAFFFNCANADEAVVAIELAGGKMELDLIDLEETFSNQTVASTCTVRFVLPAGQTLDSGLVFHSGTRGGGQGQTSSRNHTYTFIVKSQYKGHIDGDVFRLEVAEPATSCQCVHICGNATAVTQLDAGHFCVSMVNRFDIWESHATKPLRTVACKLPSAPLTKMFSEAGTLIHVEDDVVEVQDWRSGALILTMSFHGTWHPTVTRVLSSSFST